MMRTENFRCLGAKFGECCTIVGPTHWGYGKGSVLHGQLLHLEEHHARSIVHHLTFMGITGPLWKNAKIVAKTHGDARNTLSENNEQVLINTMSHRAARGGRKQEGGEKEANA